MGALPIPDQDRRNVATSRSSSPTNKSTILYDHIYYYYLMLKLFVEKKILYFSGNDQRNS